MEFFIPHAKDAEEAKSVYSSIAQFIKAPSDQKRIFKIKYEHNGIKMTAEVGKPINSYYKERMPEVIAILQNGPCYCVCLRDRGVVRGEPIYVGDDQFSTFVEYFE